MAISTIPTRGNPIPPKSVKPESWQTHIETLQPSDTPKPATERPAPITPAAAEARAEAEKYVERQNDKLRRRREKQQR